MNTMTSNNHAAAYKNTKKTIIGKFMTYLNENMNAITLGMYSISGKIPDFDMLRAMHII